MGGFDKFQRPFVRPERLVSKIGVGGSLRSGLHQVRRVGEFTLRGASARQEFNIAVTWIFFFEVEYEQDRE